MEPTKDRIITEIHEISSQLTKDDFKKLSKDDRIILSIVLEKGVFDKKDNYVNSMVLSDLKYKLINLRDNKTDQPSEKPKKVQRVFNKIKGAHSPYNLEKLAQKRAHPANEEHPLLNITYREEAEAPLSRLNPLEILDTSNEIMQYLPLSDLKSLSQVSRTIKAHTDDPIVMKKIKNLETLIDSIISDQEDHLDRKELINLVSEAKEKHKGSKEQLDYLKNGIIEYYKTHKDDTHEPLFDDFINHNIHQEGILFNVLLESKLTFLRAFVNSKEEGVVGLDNLKALFKFLKQDEHFKGLWLGSSIPFDQEAADLLSIALESNNHLKDFQFLKDTGFSPDQLVKVLNSIKKSNIENFKLPTGTNKDVIKTTTKILSPEFEYNKRTFSWNRLPA